jgi:hypothetical protein
MKNENALCNTAEFIEDQLDKALEQCEEFLKER